jgi:pyruvate formate lyase activating enzyme
MPVQNTGDKDRRDISAKEKLLMVLGTVFDIKEFSVNDGPGLRVTVFLKGCPLRCVWCHNPEGISSMPQLMKNESKCRHCGLCQSGCSHEECRPFGVCTRICPDNLIGISGKSYNPAELIEIIRRYTSFFEFEGGVTFSGGEPLMQPEFLIEVLEGLNGVHTAVETSGYVGEDVFKAVARLAGLVYIDIKHMDSAVHKKLTGAGNERILRNVNVLKTMGRPFVVRIPLIPSLTDDNENLVRTAEFLADAKDRVRVELLPYNKMTGAKYRLIGMEYRPCFDESGKVNANTRPFRQKGIDCIALKI